jgi:copper chaperone
MSNVSQTVDTRDYTVAGMTCAHCVISVREEVSEVPGVIAVDVDLASGQMSVSAEDLNDDAIRAAVEEAGYELASVRSAA